MKKYILIACMISSSTVFSQSRSLTLQHVIEQAMANNAGVKSADYQWQSQKQLKTAGFDLPKTELTFMRGQYNSSARNDNNVTVAQTIPFTALGSQGKLNRSLVMSAALKADAIKHELEFEVKQAYYQLAFAMAYQALLLKQDSIFAGFLQSASLRYKTGEANLLEKVTAETQYNEAQNKLREHEGLILTRRVQLQALIQSETPVEITEESFEEESLTVPVDSVSLQQNPAYRYAQQQTVVATAQKKMEVARLAPDLLVGFFSQTLIGTPISDAGGVATSRDRFTGFQVGIAIPLWFVPHQARIKAAEYNRQAAHSTYENQGVMLQSQWQQAYQAYLKNKNSLTYYRASALPNADLMLSQSQAAFKAGEIDYATYLLGVRSVLSIRESHLQTLLAYNLSIAHIKFLSGNK